MPKKQLRPAPKALDVAIKEFHALEGIWKVFDMMDKKHIHIEDPVVFEQIRTMLSVAGDLRKLIEGSETRSDKEIESNLMDIHSKIRLQFSDDIRLKMDAFFELMDPAVAKTEEWKQMYQVYLKFSAPESPEVINWNREKLKLDIRFSKLTEKVPIEELKVINQSIRTSREKNANLILELKAKETPENDEKREQLEREKEHLKQLAECWAELNDIGKEVKNLLKIKPGEAILDDVMRAGKHLYNQVGIRQGRHSNSKEFDEMILALDLVANWDTPDTLKTLMLAGDTYRSMDTMLKLLKLTAQTYLDKKHEQFRPFPSAKRRARLAFAESLIEFVDEHLEKLNARSKDTIDVEAYKTIIDDPAVNVPDGNRNEANLDDSFTAGMGVEKDLNISVMNIPDC